MKLYWTFIDETLKIHEIRDKKTNNIITFQCGVEWGKGSNLLTWGNDAIVAELEVENPVLSFYNDRYKFQSAIVISLKKWNDCFEKVLTSPEYSYLFYLYCNPTNKQKKKLVEAALMSPKYSYRRSNDFDLISSSEVMLRSNIDIFSSAIIIQDSPGSPVLICDADTTIVNPPLQEKVKLRIIKGGRE